MFKGKRIIYWLIGSCIIISAILVVPTVWIGKAQQKPKTATILQRGDKPFPKQPTDKQLDDAATPIVDYAASTNLDVDETRKQKNKNNNGRGDVGSEGIPDTEVSYVSESIIPDFPVEMSDLIIEGIVTDSKAFLSEDKTGVYSEFTVSVTDVIKSDPLVSINKHDSIITERFGGRVRYPSGVIVRYLISGKGSPMKDTKYLFFLKKTDSGDYRILTGYEMRGNKVYALDGSRISIKGNGKEVFDKHNGKEVQEFKKELDKALKEGKNVK